MIAETTAETTSGMEGHGGTWNPEDTRWDLTADACPLALTAWYHAQPSTHRARLGFALHAALLHRAHVTSTVIQDALFTVALRLSDDQEGVDRVLSTIEAERRRASILRDAIAELAEEDVAMARGDEVARWLEAVEQRWPDLALVLATVLPDPLSMLRDLTARGLHPRPVTRTLSATSRLPDPRRIVALGRAVMSMSRVHRALLGAAVPLALSLLLPRLRRLPPITERSFGVPRDVLEQVRRDSRETDPAFREALDAARTVCEEIGLVGPAARGWWRLCGLEEASRDT